MKKILIIILIVLSCILTGFLIFTIKEYGFKYTIITLDDMASEEDIKKLINKIDLRNKELKAKEETLRKEAVKLFLSKNYKKINFDYAYYGDVLAKKAGETLYNYVLNHYSNIEIKNQMWDKWDIENNISAEYFDIDDDKKDEIIGKVFIDDFYNDEKGGTHIFILKKVNGKWKDISNMSSFGEIFIYNKKIHNCYTVGVYNGYKGYRNRSLSIGKINAGEFCNNDKK